MVPVGRPYQNLLVPLRWRTLHVVAVGMMVDNDLLVLEPIRRRATLADSSTSDEEKVVLSKS